MNIKSQINLNLTSNHVHNPMRMSHIGNGRAGARNKKKKNRRRIEEEEEEDKKEKKESNEYH